MPSLTIHFTEEQMRAIEEYASLLGLSAGAYVAHALDERLDDELACEIEKELPDDDELMKYATTTLEELLALEDETQP